MSKIHFSHNFSKNY